MADPVLPVFAITAYRIPSITGYNRLESTPRRLDFDRSLKAEVRDAIWMLTRQWQFGEFKGEDAASAVTTKILSEQTVMDQVQFPGNGTFPYNGQIPLETVVEREKLVRGLSLSIQMARYLIRLIKLKPDFENGLKFLMLEYPLNYTPEQNDYEGLQLLHAVQGKVFDGFSLFAASQDGTVPAGITARYASEIEDLSAWYKRNYNQPDDTIGSAWVPSQLEYNFSINSSGEQSPQKLVADHYDGGHLDWYSFDMERNARTAGIAPAGDGGKENLQSYIPTPLTFRGMPNPRFWMMEEGLTDFGKISTTPTGLLHLLLAEFGLTCSNDWFMLPYQVALNTLCEIKGVVVKDVFGEYTLIRPAGRGPETQWHRWSIFHHTDINNKTFSANSSLYIAPTVINSLMSDPLEQVNFLRDEMANMVWGVENTVPSAAGKGISGDEMALKTDDDPGDAGVGGEEAAPRPLVRYVLGTTVPENWCPFIPVHMEGSDSEIQFQRAKLPGITKPRGVLLNEKAAPYYVAEHIIKREGLLALRHFEFARAPLGASYLWIGRRTETGKGEGWSNLKFDQVENV
jgi:hypothetical protein